MTLADAQIRTAKPGPTRRKLSDGGGLSLVIAPTGGKSWWFRVREGGVERTITLGKFPDLTLKAAREKAAELRAQMAEGKDVVIEAKRAKTRADLGLGGTFADLCRAYMTANEARWSKGHASRFRHRMERDVLPQIGHMKPDTIQPIDVAGVARRIMDRGATDTGKRVAGMIGQVLLHGVVLGEVRANAAQGVSGALGSSPTVQHRPALLSPDDLGPFLRVIDAWPHQTAAKPLLWAILRTAARPGDVRQMRWDQIERHIDGSAVWVFSTGKTGTATKMPLARQMIDLIDAQQHRTGKTAWVFAGPNGKPLSDVATAQFVDRLGYRGRMSAHGARAILRTVAVETLGHPEAVVEMALGHDVRDIHGKAYNRVQWAVERAALAQDFNDWLDATRDTGGLPLALPPPE